MRYLPVWALCAVAVFGMATENFTGTESSRSPRSLSLSLSPPFLLCCRRSLPLVGGVAGPGQAKPGFGVSASLRVLPDADDCELPGAELHRRPCRSSVRVAACVPPEQPDHGA